MDRPPSIGTSRREALVRIAQAGAGILAASLTVPALRILLGPAVRERAPRPEWTDLGPVAAFGTGITPLVLNREARLWIFPTTRRIPLFVRRNGEETPRILSGYCTHRGCPVDWSPERGQFHCPCHNGLYDREGSVLAGPPPRPLQVLPVRIVAGRLLVKAD